MRYISSISQKPTFENHFQDYYTDLMTDLSNPNIEGVYEMNVPLEFRLLMTLGCICSLRKEHYRSNKLSNLYQFDELESLSLSEQTYLQAGTLQCIYLYIHQDNGKLFIALFIPNNCRVFIGVYDSIRENHLPNLNKLLKSECEKRLRRGIDANLLPINEHQFEVKVDTDLQNVWKRFNKIFSWHKGTFNTQTHYCSFASADFIDCSSHISYQLFHHFRNKF